MALYVQEQAVNLTGGANGLTSYSWSGPGGFTSNSQNPTVSPAVAGAYVILFQTHLHHTAATTVVVNALPAATAGNNGPVCTGSNVTLSGGANGMTSYTWSGPGGFTSTQQNPTVAPAVAGAYTLTVSNGTCTNTATTTVVVNPVPTATASNNGPICAGSPLNLTGGPNGMTSYTWTGPNSYSSTLQSPTITEAGLYPLQEHIHLWFQTAHAQVQLLPLLLYSTCRQPLRRATALYA